MISMLEPASGDWAVAVAPIESSTNAAIGSPRPLRIVITWHPSVSGP